MNFDELILTRESCRKYKDQPVEREKITACLEAARLAPSACNSQPWGFTVVTSPELRQKVAKTTQDAGMNRFTETVPAFVVVTEEQADLMELVRSKVDSQEYAQFDMGLAASQLVLKAAELGLGTCILGWFNEPELKQLLHLPEERRIRVVICVGYSVHETPRKKVRKALDEIVTWA